MLQNVKRLVNVFVLTVYYTWKINRIIRLSPEKSKETVEKLKKDWAIASLKNLGVSFQVKGASVAQEPLLFVGNHLSYLDIPLIMAVAPVAFVAKEELSHWPVIGSACKSVGTVFVKRESVDSRKSAVDKIADACILGGQSICLFPSGTTSVNESKPWRRGAFEIAKVKSLKVQPFRLNYFPRDIVAFVGDDALVPHLWRLLRTSEVKAEIEFYNPINITDSEKSVLEWQNWAAEIVNND